MMNYVKVGRRQEEEQQEFTNFKDQGDSPHGQHGSHNVIGIGFSKIRPCPLPGLKINI